MNDDLSTRTREALSALADGQLQGEDFAGALSAAADPDALSTWHCYHLIGDVLRSGEARADAAHDHEFLARLRGRLAAEAPPARPVIGPEFVANNSINKLTPSGFVAQNSERLLAVNDSLWRWKAVAGVASVAAVGALAWSLVGPVGGGAAGGGGAVLARSVPEANESMPVLVASPQGAILRDARLDELLDAHRQVGGGSVLQVPAGFLRNATFEGRAR